MRADTIGTRPCICMLVCVCARARAGTGAGAGAGGRGRVRVHVRVRVRVWVWVWAWVWVWVCGSGCVVCVFVSLCVCFFFLRSFSMQNPAFAYNKTWCPAGSLVEKLIWIPPYAMWSDISGKMSFTCVVSKVVWPYAGGCPCIRSIVVRSSTACFKSSPNLS